MAPSIRFSGRSAAVRRCARFAAVAAACLAGTAGAAPSDAVRLSPALRKDLRAFRVPAPGVHPRILFGEDEIPRIRERAKTPSGRAAVWHVAWQADHPGKAALEKARRGEAVPAEDLIAGAFNNAFLRLATGEASRLANARDLLGAWAKQHATTVYYNRNAYMFALAYDWLHRDLPPEVRDAMRENMAGALSAERLRTWETAGYYKGPVITGRPCDWGAIESGGTAMLWLAVAGEDPRASREYLARTVSFMQYIADWGLTAEGHLNAGNGYATGDFINYGYAVRALDRHGVRVVDHPHLRAFAVWLAYESVPGMYVFDNRNFSGGYHGGLSPLVLALAARHGGPAAWLADQALGPDRTGDCGVPGLLWGPFAASAVPPPGLPLRYRSSSMGTVLSREGWNEGSFFCSTMEPVVPGKTHSDKGSFTFYSHGQAFAADPGVGFPNSEDHNIVLVDGEGQYNHGGMSVTDAVPRGFLANGLADFTHTDLRPAYERRAAYTRTRPGPVVFGALEYGRGLPFRWEIDRPMVRADRFALYVRGSARPYAVILDDIQRDGGPRLYQWLMHSRAYGTAAGPGRAAYTSRYGGEYLQSETGASRASFAADLPAAGRYAVYALARKWPAMRAWTSHHAGVSVNGKTTSFYLNDYLDDWSWHALGAHDLRAGRNTAEVGVGRGGRFAQVVAVPEGAAPPAAMLGPRAAAGAAAPAVVFGRNPLPADAGWSVRTDPRARMDLHFIHPGAGDLQMDFWRKPRSVPLCLRAGQRAVRAGFAAVLVPYDDGDPVPEFRREAGGAVLRWGASADYLRADPAFAGGPFDSFPVATDGRFALVRVTAGRVAAYALVGGTTLSFRGEPLVRADAGPVNLLHDGTMCSVQAPPGARVRAARMEAASVVCNERAAPVFRGAGALEIRAAARGGWRARRSADGTLVTIAGDGPPDLRIHAPEALACVVNGVSVWFSRDGAGNIRPKIELTALTHGAEPAASTPVDAVPTDDGAAKAPVRAEIPLPRDGWRFRRDPGDAGRAERWFAPALDEAAWTPIGIGDFWDNFGIKYTGAAWYRGTFSLPARPAGAEAVELAFGAVDEMAWVWLNGEFAGEFSEYGPAGWTEPFSLDVTRLLRWGAENRIAVRVMNTAAGGGIYKPVTVRVLGAAKP